MKQTSRPQKPEFVQHAGRAYDDASSYAIPGRTRQKIKFFGKHENASVHGYQIGGLVYVGKLDNPDWDEEPAVIDPSLPIQRTSRTEPLDYWFSYFMLDEAQRDRYLAWLSRGRAETGELGYAFLYFYGFERYVLVDAAQSLPDERNRNLEAIAEEILRLQPLFGQSRKFDRCSNQLLDAIYVRHWPERIDERKSAFPTKGSVAAKFAIARAANTTPDTPLDSDWALHWLLGFGSVSRTRTIREHYPLLRSLFRAKYEAMQGGGIKVPRSRTELYFWLDAASMGLYDVSRIPAPEGWCDPTSLKRPLGSLGKVYAEVLPTIRALAKAMTKQSLAETLAACHPEVPADALPEALQRAVEQIKKFVKRQPSPDIASLGKLMGIDIAEKATSSQLRKLAAGLAACGYVLVPDPLLTPATVKVRESVSIYAGARPENLSPEGKSAALSVHLGCLLALADGEVHQNEKDLLWRLINVHPNASERQYLEHYLWWRLGHAPSATGLKRQIVALELPQRDEMGQLLIDVALADGVVLREEVKQLEKLFMHLGLDATLVSQRLHASAGSAPAPARAKSRPPARAAAAGDRLQLDRDALAQHAESTKDVQDLLHRIF